jgi:Zinc finger, C3HC4 type (RING finger)
MNDKPSIRLSKNSTRRLDRHSIEAKWCRLSGKGNDVIGHHNVVRGNYNHVVGDFNIVIGNCCRVSGRNNIVIGDHNIVDGDDATVTGDHNKVSGKNCILDGLCNTYDRHIPLPPKDHKDEPAGETDACSVCLTNKKCCAVMPCRHLCLCAECSHGLAKNKAEVVCPICRNGAEEIVLMF